MKILAVDSSSVSASAAICEDDFLLGEIFVNIKQMHSETLMPAVSELLKRCGVRPADIGLYAVTSGPGSFTGVRIGVSAVKGMAMPAGTPCAAVSSLEAAAMNLPCVSGIICAVMDARRGQFYNALFESEGLKLTRLTQDRAIGTDTLSDELKSLGKNIIMVGDGAQICYTMIEDKNNIAVAPERLRFPRASGVAACALQLFRGGSTVSPEALEPFYLRLPQAERELKKRMEGTPK